jgi:hypothetical protein
LVFLTEPSLCQPGTAGMVAWVFCLSWHSSYTSLFNIPTSANIAMLQATSLCLLCGNSTSATYGCGICDFGHNKSPHCGTATMKALYHFCFSL